MEIAPAAPPTRLLLSHGPGPAPPVSSSSRWGQKPRGALCPALGGAGRARPRSQAPAASRGGVEEFALRGCPPTLPRVSASLLVGTSGLTCDLKTINVIPQPGRVCLALLLSGTDPWDGQRVGGRAGSAVRVSPAPDSYLRCPISAMATKPSTTGQTDPGPRPSGFLPAPVSHPPHPSLVCPGEAQGLQMRAGPREGRQPRNGHAVRAHAPNAPLPPTRTQMSRGRKILNFYFLA